MMDRCIDNVRREVELTDERTATDVPIPGLDSQLVHEQLATGAIGSIVSRYVFGNVGPVLSATACSGFVDAWPWAEVVDLASPQASKVRDILDHGPPWP